jgi:hypothetical protein
MTEQGVPEPAPFFIGATPVSGEIEAYIIAEFERLRKKRPIRVEVVYAPAETGVIVYLEEVTEEDRLFVEKLQRRLSEVGEPAMVVPTAGTGIATR